MTLVDGQMVCRIAPESSEKNYLDERKVQPGMAMYHPLLMFQFYIHKYNPVDGQPHLQLPSLEILVRGLQFNSLAHHANFPTLNSIVVKFVTRS